MDTFPLAGRDGAAPDIPDFDPVRSLGRGSQGHVWLVAPRDGSAPLAAKFLGPVAGDGETELCDDGAARHNESRITHEWRVLAQFRHEHLVQAQRLARDAGGAPVLLMDFAEGGSLHQIVQARGPLTVGEAVTVLTPMGQVLAFLHGRGAVHGDVSPGNVLLTAAGKPLLADFGFGRLLGQAAGPPAGTPGYHCPGDTGRDGAADVYALASVGWFALTGRPAPPTRERTPLVALVPEVPPELVAALEAGLDENPAHRPTAAAFAQAVFRSARAEAVVLGNAVHPSVLPELPTRRDVRIRGRGAGKRRSAGRLKLAGPVRAVVGLCRRVLPPRIRGRRPRRLAGMWDGGGRRAPRTRGARRWAATAAIAALAAMSAAVLLASLTGGWGLLRAGGVQQRAPSPAASPGGEDMAWARALPPAIQSGLADEDPVAALAALAWTRSYALATTDAGLLAHVNAQGSPAAAADSAILRRLLENGHTLTGFESSISKARTAPEADSADTATVLATVATGPFAEQDAAGNLVHRTAQGQLQELAIVLLRVDGRWLVREVRAPAG
ncbi:serine/threonine-protein kinase [Arthrobacter sp. HY1533]|uniref:serine/threonine-protein kinase n=1 Tax=Arthrobacter sp. HY1533 TaxID=2970919 RepID=UPI0022B9E25F|nr:serine/threonine-protein kinase [Arthrobacter sp. HY1533]